MEKEKDNLEVEIQKAKEIQDEFGGEVSIPSWMDDPDLLDFGDDEETTEVVMNVTELEQIIEDVVESNNKVVTFQDRYDEYLQNKLKDEYNRNKQKIEELNNSVSTTLVDMSSLSKIREAKQSIINKKGEFTDKDTWRLVSIMPQGFKEPLSALISEKFKSIASTRRLSQEEIQMLIDELDRFERIVKPNIRKENQEDKITSSDRWVINNIGLKEQPINMSDIDVVYVVNSINKYKSITGHRTKDEIVCQRAKIENINLTQSYIDISYPENITIPTPPDYLTNKAKAIKIVNKELWKSMGISEKDSVIYILPYIKVNKMLIVIGDKSVYNEIIYDLDRKLEDIVTGNYTENVDYVRVIGDEKSLEVLSNEQEEFNYTFKMYTNEELEKLISENIITDQLIDNININFPSSAEKPDRDNNEDMKSDKLPGSIFIFEMNNIIRESGYQSIVTVYNTNKAKIQRRLINAILPRIVLPNQIESLLVDSNYLLGDNSWFYKSMERFNDEEKLEVIAGFLRGDNDYLFESVTIDDILSIPSLPRKSKKKLFVEELKKRANPYKDLIETDTSKKVNNISNVMDLINYHVDKRLRELDALSKKTEVNKGIIEYVKGLGLNTNESVLNIESIQLTEEVNGITTQQLIYSLKFNDNSVIRKSDLPYALMANLTDNIKHDKECKLILKESLINNKDMDNKSYSKETVAIIKQILRDEMPILEPIISRIVDIIVTDKLIENIDSEKAVKRIYNNANIIITDVFELSSAVASNKEVAEYVNLLTLILSKLYNSNEKLIGIFLAILNEEIMSIGSERISSIILEDLSKYKVETESAEFKKLMDIKSKELMMSKFIPFSFNEYQKYSKEYKEKIKEIKKTLEVKETHPSINVKNLKNLMERSNLTYAAYLRTGNSDYIKDINRDYVSAELLMFEDGVDNIIVGEYSPTAMLEKYNMEDRRDEFEDDESFDYQSMILEIEKSNPNLKYTLPKPVVDFIENTEIVVPQDMYEYFTNSDTKFDISITNKGR